MTSLAPLAKRILLVASTTVVVVVATAGSASASSDSAGMFGFDLKDTHDISIWSFDLSINGGGVTNADARVWSMLMHAGWTTYRSVMGFMIWLLDWTLTMGWIEMLLAPLEGFAVLARGLVDKIGLMPLMLTVLACVVGYWMLKGRYAGGFTELLIGCVIAATATGAMADPMAAIAGDSGLIMQGRDAGVELATAVADGDINAAGDESTVRSSVTGSMVDALIRVPHQIINYGGAIDGMPCEGTYDDNVGKSDARDAIGGCDEAYRVHADSPNPGKVGAINELIPTAVSFMVFSIVLVLILMLSVLSAGWCGIKLIWELIVGIMPGDGRGAMFRSLANLIFAVVMVAITTVFVVAWMQILVVFFSSSNELPWMIRIRLFNIVLLGGIVVLFMMRSRVKKGLEKIAARVAALGPSPSTMAEPSKLPGAAAKAGMELLRHKALVSSLSGGKGSSAQIPNRLGRVGAGAQQPGPVDVGPATIIRTSTPPQGASARAGAPRTLGAGGGPALLGPGGGPALLGPGGPGPTPPGGAGAPSTSPSGSGSRLRARLKTAASLGAQAAAAYVTGGTSTLATGARAATTSAKIAKVSKAVKTAETLRTGPHATSVPQTRRNQAVRQQLHAAQAQAPRMRDEGRYVVDEQSGASFSRRSVATSTGARAEILQPVHADPASRDEAQTRQPVQSSPAPAATDPQTRRPGRPTPGPASDPQAARRLTERLANGARLPRADRR